MTRDYSSKDREILEAIQSFNGISSSEALAESGLLSYNANFISQRIKANSELSRAQNKRAIKYIKSLSEDELLCPPLF